MYQMTLLWSESAVRIACATKAFFAYNRHLDCLLSLHNFSDDILHHDVQLILHILFCWDPYFIDFIDLLILTNFVNRFIIILCRFLWLSINHSLRWMPFCASFAINTRFWLVYSFFTIFLLEAGLWVNKSWIICKNLCTLKQGKTARLS